MVGAGAAAVAPEFRAMLEWLGMISVGADVTISVNWDGATPEDHPMIGLTDQLSKLTDVRYSVFLGIDDTASGPLSAIQTYVNNLDGRSVTTYVDTVYSGAPAGMARPGHRRRRDPPSRGRWAGGIDSPWPRHARHRPDRRTVRGACRNLRQPRRGDPRPSWKR